MPKIPTTYLYLDTEFTSLHQHAHLLSIALVSDTGDSFYAEFTDYPKDAITPWIAENVLANFCLSAKNQPKLKGKHWRLKNSRTNIISALEKFLNQFDTIKIWADHVAYDWVLFCELFGGALKLPNNIHYMPLDLPTALFIKGLNPDLDRAIFVGEEIIKKFPKIAKQKHNALYDTYILKASVEKLFP